MESGIAVRANLVRALIAGAVGTIIFTVMGKFMAPHIIGQPMDVAALIAAFLGSSYVVGLIVHLLTGTVVFPLAYLVFGHRYLPGPDWLRGVIFLIPLYLVAMVVVMPVLGQGLFFDSAPKAMVALVGHLIFGLAMGLIIGKPIKGKGSVPRIDRLSYTPD